MEKFYINEDEYWPFYNIEKPEDCYYDGPFTEIPPGKVKWIKRVAGEMAEVQEYLSKLYERGRK